MMSENKYQIFLSSTYEDLKQERAELSKAVLSVGHIPVGMEGFNAADDASWDLIKKQIDQCDYYCVIVAHRYGSTNEDGISFTELEYDYARSKGVPCLGFLIDDKASWPAEFQEGEEIARSSLREFKSKLKEKQIAYWSTKDELATQFLASLLKAFNSNPRPGWVRADSSMSRIASSELARLSNENAELKQIVSELKVELKQDEKYEMRKLSNRLYGIRRDFSVRFSDTDSGEFESKRAPSLHFVFAALAPRLVVEDHLASLCDYFPYYTRPHWEEPADEGRSFGSPRMPHNTMQDWLTVLLSFGLVKPSDKKHPVSDTNQYWTLDETGIELLKHIRLASIEDEKLEEREGGPESDLEGTETDDSQK